MTPAPRQLTLPEWDARLAELSPQPAYGGALGRHVAAGDSRLPKFLYDNSTAALDLWNFLLTEEDRLRTARQAGRKIVGAMKDLGTVPVMAYAHPELVAFYPDGAWWIPCVMELNSAVLAVADQLGIDESFCPVRAMLGAFVTQAHFPLPDLLVCSAGATCDDFSAIAQRLNGLGHPVLWWELPHRRAPVANEAAVCLPGGFTCPRAQVDFVAGELRRVQAALENAAGSPLTEAMLAEGIRVANRIRQVLAELRQCCFSAARAPLPALEILIAEMLAIHFCSDRAEALRVLDALRAEAGRRMNTGQGYFPEAIRTFWVNPVADLRVMNMLEAAGGRLCGTDFMFCHALDAIPEDLPPLEALARMALADPMAGSAQDRARRICRDARAWQVEAMIISRIPGASHCALEGEIIAGMVEAALGIPILELEVPPVTDALAPALLGRMKALMETAQGRRPCFMQA